MSDRAVRCMWMRGGTSKGGYFLADELPDDRDAFLLRVMGSPDPRQIDGMGGADPLTSKVAIVQRSQRPGVDVDYLFLQVMVDRAIVTDAQNCGNILAGVGPFAIERGLVSAHEGQTPVTIHMANTGQTATAMVQTPGGRVQYEGDAEISGVPGSGAPVLLAFQDTAGSTSGALLPTGHPRDTIAGLDVTLIDDGMPVVVLRASDVGIDGTESREKLEGNLVLREKLEAVRLEAGPLMNLGDVADKSVPKLTMVSPPTAGGAISTRTFIPHRCHASIGVLGAVSVATACLLPDGPAAEMANVPAGPIKQMAIEHPSGALSVVVETDENGTAVRSSILRTARKLMDGTVFD